jgi:D-alanyl-D-alanine carboxypeptidase
MNKMTHICSKNLDHKLEIASMTKIMTAYTCCRILFGDMQAANINPKKVYFRASHLGCRIGGTTAQIREGLRYSIYDLLIGLMLPSGNDAALVLAENFGRFIAAETSRTSLTTLKDQCEQDPYDPDVSKSWMARFIKRMNQEAAKLKLVNSSFSNPHGLSDKANKSSA